MDSKFIGLRPHKFESRCNRSCFCFFLWSGNGKKHDTVCGHKAFYGDRTHDRTTHALPIELKKYSDRGLVCVQKQWSFRCGDVTGTWCRRLGFACGNLWVQIPIHFVGMCFVASGKLLYSLSILWQIQQTSKETQRERTSVRTCIAPTRESHWYWMWTLRWFCRRKGNKEAEI